MLTNPIPRLTLVNLIMIIQKLFENDYFLTYNSQDMGLSLDVI